jgi:thymidylate synthase (FAD)
MSTDGGFKGWGPKGWRCTTTECGWKTDGDKPDYCPRCGFVRSSLESIPGDEKLLRFLWENQHSTPFEVAGLTIEVQAPIFVFREWHRHRVPFGYNELSARYTPLPDVNYVPSLERCMLGSDGKNKQAGTIKGADVLHPDEAELWRQEIEGFYAKAEALYQHGLKIGLPKELARIVVPVGRYSRMRATGNLRGWLGFLKLRMAAGAQWEIRQFANVLGTNIIAANFPRTWELFAEAKA